MAHFQTIKLDAIQVTPKRGNKINNILTHLKLHEKQKMLKLLQEGVLNSKKLRNWWQLQSSVDQNLAQLHYKLPVKKKRKQNC